MPNPITRTVTGVRVAVRQPRTRTIAGSVMAAIGVLVILTEIGLHVYSAITHTKYEMDHTALLSGAVVGFVGFYLIDSKSATATANIVVGSGAQIIRAVRGGRRSTDTPVVVPAQREDKP
jgi:Tfp pilus assembly major pilin PilA